MDLDELMSVLHDDRSLQLVKRFFFWLNPLLDASPFELQKMLEMLDRVFAAKLAMVMRNSHDLFGYLKWPLL